MTSIQISKWVENKKKTNTEEAQRHKTERANYTNFKPILAELANNSRKKARNEKLESRRT